MRWLTLWMFVAGGAGAMAVQESRAARPAIASAATSVGPSAPQPTAEAPEAAEAPVEVRVAPPRQGFGGVPAAPPPAVATTMAIDESSLENDSGDCIPDVADRCPDEPEDRDGFGDDDGCPEPMPLRVIDRPGGRIILEGSKIIFY